MGKKEIKQNIRHGQAEREGREEPQAQRKMR